ncbi:MAG: hypothetical protein KF799_09155 [Bdellovibrionales bacterium]|nr:hypothetical protein [Bdellovibrionales bacterium]
MPESRLQFQSFEWLDVANPTSEVLNKLAEQYQLHPTSVQDCLQPEHLPKFEMIEDVGFVVLRAYDPDCAKEADSVQELTRKIAIFYSERFVISIHRQDQPFMTALLEKWKKRKINDPVLTPEHVLIDILNEVVLSYQSPIMSCLGAIELFEAEIFHTSTQRKFRINKGYYVKRKVSVFKHMLRATREPVNRILVNAEAILVPHFQNISEQIDQQSYYASDIEDSMNSLLNLHVSLQGQRTNEASRRTNEVMRVLTIFSCFFLPINFIASIYGMNFEHMPEIKDPFGYWYALAFMATVSLVIFMWFRRKGWLKKADLRDSE